MPREFGRRWRRQVGSFVIRNPHFLKVPNTQFSYTLKKLKPNEKVNTRVTAINDSGKADPEGLEFTTTATISE